MDANKLGWTVSEYLKERVDDEKLNNYNLIRVGSRS